MAYIEKFLGKKVEIPEDRRYWIKPGVWAREKGSDLFVGLTEPELVLAGGINDVDWLVVDGEEVEKGQAIGIAITGKIKYLESPAAGLISFNPLVEERPATVGEDPYERGWLFRVTTKGDPVKTLLELANAEEYIEALQNSEGCKNPEGLKGGVSGICKAVYTGIKGQKF